MKFFLAKIFPSLLTRPRKLPLGAHLHLKVIPKSEYETDAVEFFGPFPK